MVRAGRPKHLPIVLTRDELRAVITELRGTPRLMATLLYVSDLTHRTGLAGGKSDAR